MFSREDQLRQEYANKLAQLKKEQAFCSHEWSEPEYDPEIKRVPIYETYFQGVDCWPQIIGHNEEKVPRWSRVCSKCGKVEYTTEQEPIEPIKYVPKFGD